MYFRFCPNYMKIAFGRQKNIRGIPRIFSKISGVYPGYFHMISPMMDILFLLDVPPDKDMHS